MPVLSPKREGKTLGQFMTPAHVAAFMVGLSQKPVSAKVLEPACGTGIFLKILEERGYKDLLGLEVDDSLACVTDVPIAHRSFVSERFPGQYDLIIGNPPYIRWKNLDADLKRELARSDLWQQYCNSLCDYLCIFILKSVELLKDGGELIFITPEYWIHTKHAEPLRDYLARSGAFTDIFHFNETPIFDDVTSSIVLFRYVKTPGRSQKMNVVKHHSREHLSEAVLERIAQGTDRLTERFQREQFRAGEPWVLAPSARTDALDAFEDMCGHATLGDIAEIGNGLVSGLDRAFQVPPNAELTAMEKKATIAVLKAKNIRPYDHGDLTTYAFLNGIVKNEKELRATYPHFHALLEPYRSELEKRYSYGREIPYWEWVFLRNQKLFMRDTLRIFVPSKERISHKTYCRFSLVETCIFPTQDVTAIFLKPDTKESIYYVIAFLNSPQVFEWLTHKGLRKGSIVEFSEGPLSRIPLKRIGWNNPREVLLHDQIAALSRAYLQKPSASLLKEIQKNVSNLL